MSVLTLNNNSITPCKAIKDIFDEVFGDTQRPENAIPGISSLPKERRNKVIMLRRQLAHGTYNIDERLDAALDRILSDITP
jgi:hypothetical protein